MRRRDEGPAFVRSMSDRMCLIFVFSLLMTQRECDAPDANDFWFHNHCGFAIINFQMALDPSSSSSSSAHASVLQPSESISPDATHVRGPDFNRPIDLNDLLRSYETIGFQATGLAKAIHVVEEMVSCDIYDL